MNWSSWVLWGFVATVVLTTIIAGAQGFGLTRISITYLLGTMFTPNRDRAKLVGIAVHMLNGWLFALVYVAVFEAWHAASWWRGVAIGFVHAAFVVAVGMPVMPALHPRMASEQQGPTASRQLEPPGFLGLHYGVQTPITILIAHMVYGAILGAFYRVA